MTDVCAEIAAGVAHEIPGRRIHPLRTGRGGNCPPARHRGRIVYRCAVENGRPAARRLHFCKHSDGSVEFLSVTTHDARRPF